MSSSTGHRANGTQSLRIGGRDMSERLTAELPDLVRAVLRQLVARIPAGGRALVDPPAVHRASSPIVRRQSGPLLGDVLTFQGGDQAGSPVAGEAAGAAARR